jgi:hypothetical protein
MTITSGWSSAAAAMASPPVPHDLDPRLGAEQQAQPVTEHGVIVGDEDPDRFHGLTFPAALHAAHRSCIAVGRLSAAN